MSDPKITLDKLALTASRAAYDETENLRLALDDTDGGPDPLIEALHTYFVTAQVRGLVHELPVIPGGVPGYEPLAQVLADAFDQSARGKGRQRHNKGGKPFLKQPIMEIGRMVGVGYQTGQIMKKVQEATTMHQGGNHGGAKAELLGAIVYSAAAYMLVAELEAKEKSE